MPSFLISNLVFLPSMNLPTRTKEMRHLHPSGLRFNIRLASIQGTEVLHLAQGILGFVFGELYIPHRPPLHQPPLLAVQVPAVLPVVLEFRYGVLTAAPVALS